MATSRTRASLLITITTVLLARVAVSQDFVCPRILPLFLNPGETSSAVNFALPEPPADRNGTVVCNPAPESIVPAGLTEGNCTFTDDTDSAKDAICYLFFSIVPIQSLCPKDLILKPDVGRTTVESDLFGNAVFTCNNSPDISTGMTEVSCTTGGSVTGPVFPSFICTFMVPNDSVLSNGTYGFPIGVTNVTCNVTIKPGVSNACMFQVKVACSGVVCMNGGVANEADCSCTCTDGYTGSNCKDKIPIVPEDNYPEPPSGVLVEKKVTIEIAVTSDTECDASNSNDKTSDACKKLVENFKVQVSTSYKKLTGFLRVDINQSDIRAGSVIIPHTPVYDYGRMTPAGRALSASELYQETVAGDLAKGAIGGLAVAPKCKRCRKPQDVTDMCKQTKPQCGKSRTLVEDRNGNSCYYVCRANCKVMVDYCNYGTCFQDAEGVMSCRCPQSSEYMYSGVNCQLKVHLIGLYVGCGVGGGLLLIAIIVMISCLVRLCKKVKKLQDKDMEPEIEMRSEIPAVHRNKGYVRNSTATAEDQENDRYQ